MKGLLKKLRWVVHFLNLYYFPEFAPEGPNLEKQKRQATTRQKQKVDLTNVRASKGQLFKVSEDGQWDKVGFDHTKLTDKIDDNDKWVIENWHTTKDTRSKLNPTKYGQIKYHLSLGKTVARVSRDLSREFKSGYSMSTVEKYKAAIEYAYHLSPIGI